MYKLSGISKSFSGKQILQDINLTIDNEVVALIGKNGAGKTTLLKIILGKINPDEGQIIALNQEIGYIPQSPSFKQTISESFNQSNEDWQIDIALEGVGLNMPLDFETKHLSGGQKTRLSFAIVLAHKPRPSILLLDEPSNNLDSEALQWLEQFITSFKGSVLVASHDRTLINNCCSTVLELSETKLKTYPGNYDNYKQQKEIELQQALEAYEMNQAERKRIMSLVKVKSILASKGYRKKRFTKDNDKAQANWHTENAQRSFSRQLKAVESRLEKIGNLDRPKQRKNYSLNLVGQNNSKKLIIRVNNVSSSFTPFLEPQNFEIRGNERLRIAGDNGVGKSTLLKIIYGSVQPSTGYVDYGQNIKIGYLSQEADGLDYQKTAIDNLKATNAKMTDIYREALALELEKTELNLLPDKLSRGQQAKLSFAKILLTNYDLLILDEPTNHLDIETKEIIEEALMNYQGALIIASHDVYFIKQIGITKTIALGG